MKKATIGKRMFSILLSAILCLSVFVFTTQYEVKAMVTHVELTGNLNIFSTTAGHVTEPNYDSYTQENGTVREIRRTVVAGHDYIAAVFGGAPWANSNAFIFLPTPSNIDYRAVFDGTRGNYTTAGAGQFYDGQAQAWAGVEFIEPQIITRIGYFGRQDNHRLNGSILEASHDGVSYTPLFTLVNTNVNGYVFGEFTNTTAYKFYRVRGTLPANAAGFNPREIKLYRDANPVEKFNMLTLPVLVNSVLPLPGSIDDVAITWVSGSPAVIGSNGVIVPGAALPADVIFTATMSWGGNVYSREFTVRVAEPIPSADSAVVEGMELIASFNFDDEPMDGAFYGAGARAAINGNLTYAIRTDEQGRQSRTALLGGSSANFWLDVTKEDGSPILKGLSEFTISYESRSAAANNNNNAWVFFAQRTNRIPKQHYERYIGVLDRSSTIQSRRFAHVGGTDFNPNSRAVATNTPMASASGLSTSDWRQVDVKFTKDATELYVNGELISRETSTFSVEDIMSVAGGFLFIGRGHVGNANGSGDFQHFNGQIANFKIWVPADERTEADKLAEAVEALALPYGVDEDQVYGNIHLPKTGVNDTLITWVTSHPNIVDTKEYEIENYDPRTAGWVTRPANADVVVTMTATIALGDLKETKSFDFTVKKAPGAKPETEAYFFSYFTGGEGNFYDEQVYFGVSQDAMTYWTDTRAARNPVLASTYSDQGVRDPFIIRSPEGDKFYIIGTDLNIWRRNGWGNSAWRNSSSKIIVWESLDLVNWSEPRYIDVAGMIHDGGHLWAPEVVYDHVTGDYFVFFATSTSTVRPNLGIGPFMFYSRTRDFHTFSEPKVWIEINNCIDTTAMQDVNGRWYRATKDETISQIAIDRSDDFITINGETHSSLTGNWTRTGRLDQFRINGTWNYGSVEGPQLFLFNERDWDEPGVPKYGLYVDRFGNGAGYWPFTTTDIGANTSPPWWGFPRPSSANATMPGWGMRKRHGQIMTITKDEYVRVLRVLGGHDIGETVELDEVIETMDLLIEEIELLDENPYTAESWANFLAAVEAAKAATDFWTSTQAQIDAAKSGIAAAIAALECNPEHHVFGAPQAIPDCDLFAVIYCVRIGCGHYEHIPNVVENAVPSAFVTRHNGNMNDLTITVTETYTNGNIVDVVSTISIRNNAEGIYDVGVYSVFVDTKGNDQIRQIYFVR